MRDQTFSRAHSLGSVSRVAGGAKEGVGNVLGLADANDELVPAVDADEAGAEEVRPRAEVEAGQVALEQVSHCPLSPEPPSTAPNL